MSINPHQALDPGTKIRHTKGYKGIILSHYIADNKVVVHKVKLTHKYRAKKYREIDPIIQDTNYSFIEAI